ncbi:MAG: transporter [Candidatus Spyradosoma sp.]
MSMLDAVLFCLAVVGVIGLGIYKARPKKVEGETKKDTSAADYFLAGRGLSWWLVGFSLIAANISTEQFVGMSGQAADWLGLAIAGYEWLAAIVLVIVAFFFLPKLLRCGVYTIPEFLETRYNLGSRTIMAISTLLILVGVPTAGVIFAGAKCIAVFFFGATGVTGVDFNTVADGALTLGSLVDGNILVGCVIIAFCAAVYVFVGGLKACAWTDLIWGSALILGGGVIAYLAITALGDADPNHLIQSAAANSGATVEGLQNAGGIDRFLQLNAGDAVSGMNSIGGKLHMIRPMDDPSIPWTALLLGLWIPNFFYWGLNQYIMQRTLASKSVAEGQMGIVFAAFLKLLIPFVVVIPGILAYNLYRDDLKSSADEKNAAAIQVVENSADANNTVYFVTGEYLLQNSDKGLALLEKNIAAYNKANPEAPLTQEMLNATVVPDVTALLEDVKNPNTTLADRIPLAQKVADWNAATFVANAPAKGLKVSQKLVGFDYDAAFPTLMKKLMKPGITWFVLAALFGAVVSSLASMLNSASTIFTMDIYHKLVPSSSPESLVKVGKIGVVVCVLIALGLAPFLNSPIFGGIFNFIQEFQGFISPGVLCVFLFGFFVPKCPRVFGWLGIVVNAALYGALKVAMPDMAFLNRMSVCLIVCIVIGALLTAWNAAKGGQAVIVPAKNEVPLEGSGKAKAFGVFVIVATLALYTLFW